MIKARIESIIFDLGNVLVDFNHLIAAKRLFGLTDKSPDEIFAFFFDSDLTARFEEGKISPQDFFVNVKEALNLKLSYDQFLPIWNEIFFLSEKNKGVYDLALTLKKNYRVALLSNINTLHFAYLKENFPVFDAFHNIIASCELGLKKPDPMIYKKTLDILGASCGERVFYTDDRPELIESARRLGIRGFVFTDLGQLKKDLCSVGINVG